MSNKIFLKTMLLASLILGGTSVALSHDFSSNSARLQPVAYQAAERTGDREDYPFEGEMLDSSHINASITRSSITELSQAYNVTFSSLVTGHTFLGLSGGKNLYVSITDPEYAGDENVEKFRTFEGEAYRIEGVRTSTGDIAIPSKLTAGRKYDIEVNRIANNLIATKDDALKVKQLIIPTSVKYIEKDAFKILKENDIKTVEFKIVSAKDDDTLEFDETVFPAGSKITWGYEPTAKEQRILDGARVTVPSKSFSNGYDYILGYDDNDKFNDLFLKIAYFVNNEKTPRIKDLPIDNIKGYDAIGDQNGTPSYDKTIDIPLEPGDVIDDENIYFLNIYGVKRIDIGGGQTKIIPTGYPETKGYYCKAKVYSEKDNISDFIDFKYDTMTSFGDFTSINGKVTAKVTPDNPGVYDKFKHAILINSMDELKSGEYLFRTRFTSLNSAHLIIHYVGDNNEMKTVDYKVESRYPYYNLPRVEDNDFNFLIKNSDIAPDFDASKIRAMELNNFYITLDIFNIEAQKPIVKSDFATRFGSMQFVAPTDVAMPCYSINLALILTVVIYTILFVIIATGYFLYAKNKFKNDEFRRVKPKLYLKNAVIAFCGLAIVILDLMFIFYRFWPLNNSNIVYNPMDPLVVGFSVATILVIGYYVKFFSNMIKAHIQKKKTDKLKLNEDVDNDGTK